MKFIIAFFMLISPVALASGYHSASGLFPENDPRYSPEPTPFNEPRPNDDPLKERTPYSDPDDSVDYQRDPDPRFLGAICTSLLDQHSRWR